MSFVSDIIGDLTGSNQAAEAAQAASLTQAGTSAQGIAEQSRQFDRLVELMSPYVSAGNKSLASQLDILGLNGPEAQQNAYRMIEGSPAFESLVSQGEEGILQNASATGGLRGGNVQGALAKFRPNMLSQLIERQLSGLGGITNMGQASAAGQAAGGQASANSITQLLQQMGAAQAGGQVAAGQAGQAGFNNLLKAGAVIGGFF